MFCCFKDSTFDRSFTTHGKNHYFFGWNVFLGPLPVGTFEWMIFRTSPFGGICYTPEY